MLNFPTSPISGQYYTSSVRSWRFNGTIWELLPDPWLDADSFSGLSPSYFLDLANHTGSVSTSQVSSLEEFVEDTVGNNFFVFGSGVTGSYNDAGNQFNISGLTASTTRHGIVRIQPGTDITVTSDGVISVNGVKSLTDLTDVNLSAPDVGHYLYYDGAQWLEDGGIISAHTQDTSIHNSIETIQDNLGTSFFRYTNGITGVYNDVSNILTFSGIAATTGTLGVASFSSKDFSVSTTGQAAIRDDLHAKIDYGYLSKNEFWQNAYNNWAQVVSGSASSYLAQHRYFSDHMTGNDSCLTVSSCDGSASTVANTSVIRYLGQRCIYLASGSTHAFRFAITNSGCIATGRVGFWGNDTVPARAIDTPTGVWFEYDGSSNRIRLVSNGSGGTSGVNLPITTAQNIFYELMYTFGNSRIDAYAPNISGSAIIATITGSTRMPDTAAQRQGSFFQQLMRNTVAGQPHFMVQYYGIYVNTVSGLWAYNTPF